MDELRRFHRYTVQHLPPRCPALKFVWVADAALCGVLEAGFQHLFMAQSGVHHFRMAWDNMFNNPLDLLALDIEVHYDFHPLLRRGQDLPNQKPFQTSCHV